VSDHKHTPVATSETKVVDGKTLTLWECSQCHEDAGMEVGPDMTEATAPEWRGMLDSSSPWAIPTSPAPELVAGYVDGWPAWREPRIWDRWQGSGHVKITVRPGELAAPWEQASVIDIETDAYTDLMARKFVIERNAYRAGTATAYRQLSGLPSLGRALHGLSYWVWVAFWPQFPTPTELASIRAELAPGARLAGVQYRDAGRFDKSVIVDPAWHPR
jgi:hypothetical protein